MPGFPSDAHAQVVLHVKMPSGILVVLRGLAGIAYNPMMTRSLLSSRQRPFKKTQSISVALGAYLQATEQSLGVEFILPITCQQFQHLHPRCSLLRSLMGRSGHFLMVQFMSQLFDWAWLVKSSETIAGMVMSSEQGLKISGPPQQIHTNLYFVMSQRSSWRTQQFECFAVFSVTFNPASTPAHSRAQILLPSAPYPQTHPEPPTILQPHPQVIDSSL